MGLLDVTLASDSVVGTNLRGGASGGGWLYCLPRLSYQRVLCLGAPRPATLVGLARVGAAVTVLSESPAAGRRMRRLVRLRGWSHVTVRRWSRADGTATERIDLLVVSVTGVTARQRAGRLV